MNNFLDLATEIERARDAHLNALGGSPVAVRKARYQLKQLLWNDAGTIIEALKIAAKAAPRAS